MKPMPKPNPKRAHRRVLHGYVQRPSERRDIISVRMTNDSWLRTSETRRCKVTLEWSDP